MPSIDAIVGIPHHDATKLRRARVRTTESLLRRAATPDGRADLSAATGIDDGDLLRWCHRAQVLAVKGIGAEYAHVLAELGVVSVDDLAACDPAKLFDSIIDVNDQHRYVRRLPTDLMVADWVKGATAAERRVR